jgi:N-acetyl-gamma-glutamyl-phosphate reductase
MPEKKIKAGVIGGSGYTGGELVRLLLHHPHVELHYVISKTHAGKKISDVHSDLVGDTELLFSSEPDRNADVVFLCLAHGESKKYLEENNFLLDKKVIDLSRDFRISQKSEVKSQKGFVYGLPELNREKIKTAQHIANPGCFATSIQLGLLPLAEKNLLQSDIHVNSTTGSTGAGQSLSTTTHFSWRNNNLSAYKVFEHEHIPEIDQSLKQLQQDFSSSIHFIPQRGSYTRGILSAISVSCNLSQKEVNGLYTDFYASHPYVHVVGSANVKQVSNTNKCFIQLVKNGNQLAIISVLDNLLKGASGQAIQNMNLMSGLEETSGLKLKANIF